MDVLLGSVLRAASSSLKAMPCYIRDHRYINYVTTIVNSSTYLFPLQSITTESTQMASSNFQKSNADKLSDKAHQLSAQASQVAKSMGDYPKESSST